MSDPVSLVGYHLSFDAEMTSAADLSLFSNTFENGDTTIVGNSEVERYVPASSNPGTYNFSGGALTINAAPNVSNGYTSGLLSTAQTFSQNQGYFEIRAQLAPGAGFWSAFWLLAYDYSAEVDIVEQPNNDGVQNYFTSVKTAELNAGTFQNAGVDLSTGYHTYGFMWTASTIQFTLDGNTVGYAAQTPDSMATAKLFILANLAVGGSGSWPGQPGSGATSSLSIDYIRAYSSDPGVPTWTGSEQASSPDTPGAISSAMVPPASAQTPAPTSTGDTLTVTVSDDAIQGDAATYRILVDGYLQGETYTASASHAAGQITTQTISGSWGNGGHTIGILFLNPASNPDGSTRNLYVDTVSYDGHAVSSAEVETSQYGFTNFNVAPTATAQSVLTLNLAEDAAQGDATFAVFVDGWQVTVPQTVTASKANATTEAFTISDPRLVAGTHNVAIAFLNPGSGDASARNLYLQGAELNNTPLSSPAWTSSFASETVHYYGLTIPS